MKKYATQATRIALVSGVMALTASCQSTKVSSAKPVKKPTQEAVMVSQIQTVDTTSTAMLENAPPSIAPVDLATDRSVAMAYAIPAQKPVSAAAAAIQDMEIASADTSMTAIDPQTSVPTPQTRPSTVMIDSFGQPDISAVTTSRLAEVAVAVPSARPVATDGYQVASADPSALNSLAEIEPVTPNSAPFVSATKNTDLNQLISKYAALYEVPENLVHHVVRRESNYNPGAVHRGNWGLMQIRYKTARGLGYDGSPNGLLDAETNLKYAVKYLRGAWLVADKDPKKTDWLYRTGYYYQAKKKQLLEVFDGE